MTRDGAYALAYRLADFVELNLNGIPAPSLFTDSELEAALDADHKGHAARRVVVLHQTA